ncbi:carboxypeptidase regulatory-like domain-containing protein [Candidatus Latescibacterota bacterium]
MLNMWKKIFLVRFSVMLWCMVCVMVSCETSPTSDITQGRETLSLSWEIISVSSSPLYGIDGKVYWQSSDNYIYAKKAETTIEPPSDVQLSDIPDDNGHRLRISWTLSPSEEDGNVRKYRIYRSRTDELTDPVFLSQFSTVEELNTWEEHSTVFIGSVMAGTDTYVDSVPLNGVMYYYWLQAEGYVEGEPDGTLSVTGTVTDGDGQPVDGALLRLYNADKSVSMYTTSLLDGSYAFNDVPPGEYYLVAKRDNYEIFSTIVTVL